MSKDVVVIEHQKYTDGYLAPHCTVRGTASSDFTTPDGYAIWVVTGQLSAGTEIEWGTTHGDEAVFVAEGEIEVDGQTCVTGGTIIVEAHCPAIARVTSDARVVHFGPSVPAAVEDGILGAPDTEGHKVHVLGTSGMSEVVFPEHSVVYIADSSCPTCRLALLINNSSISRSTASHYHTEDEIIHVLDGELKIGRLMVGPGESVAVPADYRYSFRSTAGYSFLNFRRNASYYVTRPPGVPPQLETVEALGAAGANS